MKAIISAVTVLVAVCILDGAWAGTWYVDGSVPKAGDGTSWEKAFKKIQAGIDKAAEADTVIVAQGTYVENIQFKGKNLILTSTNPLNWNTVASTVIDANKSGSVVRFAGTENHTCVLSGFTIRNGAGTWIAQDANFSGGGILGVDPAVNPSMTPFTHATIQNNIITSNSADIGAGGGRLRRPHSQQHYHWELGVCEWDRRRDRVLSRYHRKQLDCGQLLYGRRRDRAFERRLPQ